MLTAPPPPPPYHVFSAHWLMGPCTVTQFLGGPCPVLGRACSHVFSSTAPRSSLVLGLNPPLLPRRLQHPDACAASAKRQLWEGVPSRKGGWCRRWGIWTVSKMFAPPPFHLLAAMSCLGPLSEGWRAPDAKKQIKSATAQCLHPTYAPSAIVPGIRSPQNHFWILRNLRNPFRNPPNPFPILQNPIRSPQNPLRNPRMHAGTHQATI